ncbi:universal stress protein [Marinomonas profundimaris]|jgi:nucleotide-binding universal stress UspA family protein|uniref:Universal stress protein n=1 Tax=Marinomonas profundimaris TaxID=1208321 RepID=W1RRD1_9GAMM|nr:universal stress protein [Marinomonas profundimaris]ETI58119.1 universal stress protein [Marinomonas profundimaris]
MLPKIKTIVYACDLENQTQSAMELVLSLAKTNQAKIILMHVMEPLNTQASNMINNYISAEVVASMRKDAQEDIHTRMKTMLSDYMTKYEDELSALEFPPETLSVSGVPSDCIQDTAKEHNADLIVMNSRTHSRLGQMILGSTANKVIHSSAIPVLVVPIK